MYDISLPLKYLQKMRKSVTSFKLLVRRVDLQPFQVLKITKYFSSNELDLIFPKRQDLKPMVTNDIFGFNGSNQVVIQV